MLALLLATAAVVWTPSAQGGAVRVTDFTHETQTQRDTRMQWFRDARFGMFIHWGLYAVPAGVWKEKNYAGASEWLQFTAQIPVADYDPLIKQFNPTEFNAEEWARIAKSAGVRYVVITSKHHDGFALYPSRQTDWDVESTPFKRDILKELSAACKKAGIVFCTYHSIMDWRHPDYVPRRPWDARADVAPDMDRYVAFMKAQLKEIVENYDPAIMWFDGEWEESWNHERGKDLYNYVRSLKPSILVNNRVDKGRAGMMGMTVGDYLGDFGTPEQEIPPNGFPGVDWESCMTMNDSWGFHQNDHNWKSADMLIHNLIDCVSKGGNYLLNVGPTALGKIPPESVERLDAMGAWLKVNGEAIYGAKAGPFPKALKWGRVTSKPGKLYLHVFESGLGSLPLPGLKAKVKKAYLLAQPSTSLKVQSDADGMSVSLPGLPKNPAHVVVLEIEGSPKVENPPIRQAQDGSVELHAVDAKVVGETAKYETQRDAIGFWTDPKDRIEWEFELRKPGTFAVEAEIACFETAEGSTVAFSIGRERLEAVIQSTKGWNDFAKIQPGVLKISSPGVVKLVVSAVKMKSWAVCNLRSVRLRFKGH